MTLGTIRFQAARRLELIGVSEILRIGAAAANMKRQGRPVIVLGAGEPDFDTPDNVKAAAERAIKAGQTKYTNLDGTPELKAAIAEKFARENGLTFALDEISVGAGAKQIIHNALMATINPEDEVILVAPYWTSYADIVLFAGATIVPVICKEESGFRLNADALERAITPRTKWLILNSPSNPTGVAYFEDALLPLLAVLRRHPHVWLMSDDIYEHLLYGDRPFVTGAQLDGELRQRCLTVNGVSKAYAMTGWRIGFGAGPKSLIAAMAVVQSQSTSNPSSVSQAAALEALTGTQAFLKTRLDIFRTRRDRVVSALNRMHGIQCRIPDGAFYTFASCERLIGRRTPSGKTIGTDRDFCEYLLQAHDVAVVPGSCFGMNKPYFRISYAASDEILEEGCSRIAAACEVLGATGEPTSS